MARIVMHLVHKNADDRWHLEQDGKDLASFATKQDAEDESKKRDPAMDARGQDGQFVVHRQDGSIESEWTYGHDPRRTPG